MKKRNASITRKTSETDITVKLTIDGAGKANVKTGIGMLDHMLELFAFHGLFDLEISAKGDLNVDIHHTNEDIGIVLGQAFKKALGDKKGIRRFGYASVPMEEILGTVVLDINGRGYYHIHTHNLIGVNSINTEKENYSLEYAEHFGDSLAKQLGMNMHVYISSPIELSGPIDIHKVLEPTFKALGLALDQATQIDPRRKGVPSTKGVID